MTFTHLAFGRSIRSDVELPLLQPAREGDAGEPAAALVVSEQSVQPEGEKILGSDDTTMTLFRSRDSVLVALNGTGWIAVLKPDSTTLTLHRDARQPDRHLADMALKSRVLGDRVVTGVVPFIPQLWGSIALHGSLLATPHGRVLLLGQSGRGKSTLSQVFQRDFGWRVLDDDTSMLLEQEGKPLRAVPMGAYSRLREDAAERLGIAVEALPGHGGGKGAVMRGVGTPDEQWPAQLVATCLLEPTDIDATQQDDSRTTHPDVVERPALSALHTLFESFFVLQADRQEQTKVLFRLAATLSSGLIHLRASFTRDVNTPEVVCAAITARLDDSAALSADHSGFTGRTN